eukprot:8880176-Ditylum_brightwellii.AAC.1
MANKGTNDKKEMMLLSAVCSNSDDSIKCAEKMSMHKKITADDTIMHVDQVEPVNDSSSHTTCRYGAT